MIFLVAANVTLGPFDTQEEMHAALHQHIAVSVSEGMCPHCAGRLNDRRECLPCNKRWTVTPTAWQWDAIFIYHRLPYTW